MTIEQTVLSHRDLSLVRSHIKRDYATLRDRTMREYGPDLAAQADRAVALIIDVIMRKIARKIDRDDAVKVFAENGWHIDSGTSPDLFAQYHDLALIAPQGPITGLSEFEAAFFLKSLDQKHFGQSKERTIILINQDFPDAVLAISNLGDEPRRDRAFGLKAILPPCADYLLWWAVRSSRLWTYFAEPVDLDENAWVVRSAPAQTQRKRPFAKAALGIRDHRLAPAISEERFFVAPFAVPVATTDLTVRAGSYLAYHCL
ncbi:hypothetical protein [Yoonia vestfoldensis]|uniref:hypothetical protein n=1 Tax=Yoonia vestfoldensis TaxID=245188 RepID=UPI00036AB0F9|nr:hypothetical protein [Yoonia vestfoldensis]